MEISKKVDGLVLERIRELMKKKAEGKNKFIGYFPNDFMPVEIAYASGAITLGLIEGGAHEPAEASGSYTSRFWDTFARAQIGQWVLGNPIYRLMDLLVMPVTTRHVSNSAEMFDYFTELETFRVPVPMAKSDFGLKYYSDGIGLFKEKLESFSGSKISDEELIKAINLQNNIRGLLNEISEMRKPDPPLISGKDFIALNHASYLLDPGAYKQLLESVRDELKQGAVTGQEGPRIMLVGSTLARGDYKVVDMLEGFGINIVIEEFSEGLTHYQEKVEIDGDLVHALADKYFTRRLPPAWFSPPAERLEALLKIAREYRVNGIVWYQLMYQEAYDIESYYFLRRVDKELGIPTLKIESDWDPVEVGPLGTRIEAFVEILKEGTHSKDILSSRK